MALSVTEARSQGPENTRISRTLGTGLGGLPFYRWENEGPETGRDLPRVRPQVGWSCWSCLCCPFRRAVLGGPTAPTKPQIWATCLLMGPFTGLADNPSVYLLSGEQEKGKGWAV